ncbi:MAG: endonuclease/exonuclease/phosphatase family protein [Flavobacteriales bacterium]|nr:endonuclease/exonuclease/phosphatase family protein [Flavobacteriales bacterium]
MLLIAGILLAVCGRTWTVDCAVLSAMICIGPTFLLKNKTNSTATGSVLFTLAQMNVHRTNSSFAGTMAAARARGADILSVQEVDARWEKALVEGLADLYPYHVVRTADDNYGIALFSRSPFEDHAVFDLNGLPAIRATVRLNELDILVLAVHLRSPESRADLKQRNMQWAALADLAINAPGPVLVVGDLNTVPWDNAAKHFNMVTSLAWGPHPLSPTWPSIAGLSLIPLDHMLTSPAFLHSGPSHLYHPRIGPSGTLCHHCSEPLKEVLLPTVHPAKAIVPFGSRSIKSLSIATYIPYPAAIIHHSLFTL